MEYGVRFVDGLMIPNFIPEENLFTIRDTPFRSNDIITATYPKCGTNWINYIIWSILHPEEPAPDGERVMNDIPFADMYGLGKWIDAPEDQVRTIQTHMPNDRVGKITPAKYVVMIRNPMDCCVSSYHFAKHLETVKVDDDEAQGIPVEAFNNFVTGNMVYGSYFSHLKSWYAHKDKPNVHVAIYEKIKENPRKEVLKLARFLGREKILEANNGILLDKIVEQTTFNVMKKNVKYTMNLLDGTTSFEIPILRKGVSGGYRKSLTPSQTEQLKDLMEKELEGTEILDYWRTI